MNSRLLAALLAVAIVVPGCVKSAPQSAPGERHPWTQAGHLRIGYPEEPDSLIEWFGHTSALDEVNNLLFAPMFRYDQKGNFVPEIATEVPTYANKGISKDGKTIVLHFRKGVTWSDGHPLTARDLRFTWRVTMDDKVNVKLRSGWSDIVAMDLPDDYTAVIKLREPNVDVLGSFGGGGGSAYPPMPEHLLAKSKDLQRDPFMTHPVSSGPWVLKTWNHGASLEFEPNLRYWRGRPKLNALTWRFIPSFETLFTQLQTHEVDLYDGVTESQISRLKEIEGISVVSRLLANERHLELNLRSPNLKDVRVRRAIATGIDWDRMNRDVYHGINQRASSDILPGSWAAPNIPLFAYDPAAAGKLLDEAGWKPGPGGWRYREGKRLALGITIGGNKQANEEAAVQMQNSLKALGVELTIHKYPVSLMFARNGPLYTGKYDLEWSVDTYGPDPNIEGLWSGKYVPPHGSNISYMDDPVVNRALSAAIRTYDRAERKRLYQIAEARIHELVPAVFLYWENAYVAHNSDLKNFKPAQYISDFWNSWEWEI